MSAEFLKWFAEGNVASCAQWITDHPIADGGDLQAHPLLRSFVGSNDGHCYRPAHVEIADLLTRHEVREFRRAVLDDNVVHVANLLVADSRLAFAEFVHRGICQPIHCFVGIKVGELLLDYGADLEHQTTRGETALAMQLRFGTVPAVQFLLERGADPNRAICMIPTDSLREKVDLLLQFDWDVNRCSLLHDANHGFGQRVITWLEYGADPNVTLENGRTALHLFASRGAGVSAIRALVNAGANVNARDQNGGTPLSLAREAKGDAAARELESLGASD